MLQEIIRQYNLEIENQEKIESRIELLKISLTDCKKRKRSRDIIEDFNNKIYKENALLIESNKICRALDEQRNYYTIRAFNEL